LYVLSNFDATLNQIPSQIREKYLLIAKANNLIKLYGKTFAPLPLYDDEYLNK
jgi:hypothetical protein